MTWFKVDDSFHSHPKVMMSSPAALGLWVVAGTWSAANMTDGFVPALVLPRLLPDSEALAKELMAVGLWEQAEGGYQFHNWTEYQPDAASLRAKRGKESSSGREGNHRRWHVTRGITVPECEYCQADAEEESGTRSGTRSGTQEGTRIGGESSRTRTREEAKASSGAAKPRKADPVWDALMAACGVDTAQIPKSSRGAYNTAVKDLKEIGATPGQITLRGRRYQAKWPTASITPTALVRRWPELDTGAAAPVSEAETERCPKHKRHSLSNCQICDSEKRGAA
jgi:hypothetical protein